MSACWVLPLGVGVARRPIHREGSLSKSAGGAAFKGSDPYRKLRKPHLQGSSFTSVSNRYPLQQGTHRH